MPSAKLIKQRIKSIKNTRQITKAMEVVSATKMRRSQASALSGRAYALAALDILKNISLRTAFRPDLLTSRAIKKTLLVVATSDKGLAGAFNSNVLRLCEAWIAKYADQDYTLVTIGKKSKEYFTIRRVPLVETFVGFGDYVMRSETEPLADRLLKGYLHKEWDRVIVFYTNFRTTLKQEAKMVEVLPIHTEYIEATIKGILPEYGKFADQSSQKQSSCFLYEYVFEPNPQEVLEQLLPTLFKIQMHHIILESNASEHSARMVAMKNASENAKELVGELTIEYNKSRQAGITRELTEITAGREALE